MKITRRQLRQIIKEELTHINEMHLVGPDGLSGRERRVYDIMVDRYPYLADYPVDVYKKAFDRVGQTGMTNMHAVAREMEMLHDDGWYDLPALTPAIPDDHPSLATGPRHPLDDDGDGNVDWNEIT